MIIVDCLKLITKTVQDKLAYSRVAACIFYTSHKLSDSVLKQFLTVNLRIRPLTNEQQKLCNL